MTLQVREEDENASPLTSLIAYDAIFGGSLGKHEIFSRTQYR
jgi:hypothetical protein